MPKKKGIFSFYFCVLYLSLLLFTNRSNLSLKIFISLASDNGDFAFVTHLSETAIYKLTGHNGGRSCHAPIFHDLFDITKTPYLTYKNTEKRMAFFGNWVPLKLIIIIQILKRKDLPQTENLHDDRTIN